MGNWELKIIIFPIVINFKIPFVVVVFLVNQGFFNFFSNLKEHTFNGMILSKETVLINALFLVDSDRKKTH